MSAMKTRTFFVHCFGRIESDDSERSVEKGPRRR